MYSKLFHIYDIFLKRFYFLFFKLFLSKLLSNRLIYQADLVLNIVQTFKGSRNRKSLIEDKKKKLFFTPLHFLPFLFESANELITEITYSGWINEGNSLETTECICLLVLKKLRLWNDVFCLNFWQLKYFKELKLTAYNSPYLLTHIVDWWFWLVCCSFKLNVTQMEV